MSRRHCVVGSLAELAGKAGLVGKLANDARSFVNPAEHVGEQIAGGVGWRAACGSFGTSGGATGGSGELAGPVAQADSSSVSAAHISLEGLAGSVFGIKGLLQLLLAPALFGPRVVFGGQCLARGVALGLVGVGLAGDVLCPAPLVAQGGQQQQDDGGKDFAHTASPLMT